MSDTKVQNRALVGNVAGLEHISGIVGRVMLDILARQPEALPMFEDEARRRMMAGKADPVADRPQGKARDEAAALMNVGAATATVRVPRRIIRDRAGATT